MGCGAVSRLDVTTNWFWSKWSEVSQAWKQVYDGKRRSFGELTTNEERVTEEGSKGGWQWNSLEGVKTRTLEPSWLVEDKF